jgi:hypothetical protein
MGAWRTRALLFLSAAAAEPAAAGAWLTDQTIITQVVGEDEGGVFAETQMLLEAPLSSRTAFVARPSAAGDAGGLAEGEVEAGLKQALLRSDNAIVSVQATALWRDNRNLGCEGSGGELRGMGGLGFADGRGFVNVEVAGRAVEGGCRVRRLEAAAGWRPNPRWLGLAEGFFYGDNDRDPGLKAQMSVVRMGRGGRGLQVGVRVNLDDGGDAAPALVLGLWRQRTP